MTMTSTELTDRYVVHELLTPTDPRTSCDLLDLHDGESPGRDIISVSTGLWFDFAIDRNIHVDAGPLSHRGEQNQYTIDHRSQYSARSTST